MKKPNVHEAIAPKDRQRVKLFFSKLNKSSLVQFLHFQTSVEKVQAIIKFADLVGVPAQYLPALITKFRELSKEDPKDSKEKTDDKNKDNGK